jgi:hypothetical protein
VIVKNENNVDVDGATLLTSKTSTTNMNLHTTTSAQKERPVKDCYECEGKKN